ncbi:hypothetical protein MSAN_01467400 [Mycena sanguinolenta]|uniref:Uncharacterized protein n=1 Tax=Mycena sanguinolenta TaxID=230812 RepID=A0A8H6YCF0_9AGAR|nr:hypothetical protein MSAN_01467400 [Mycena sanguinolenta]
MPKASSSARIRRPGPRPGPLKDLPLDLDLLLPPNLPQKPSGIKRVHSPGGPSLFSPQKRRILEEEGIFPSKTAVRVRASPVRRDESPVKKLDFGPPKLSPASVRSPHSAPANATEPHSPRLTRQNTTSDAFSSSTTIPHLSSHDADEMSDYFASPSRGAPARGAVTQIPREIPPPVDPQSIHYPGFVVFQDAYLVTGMAIDVDPASKDDEKENVLPRRKPRKSVTAPASSDLKPRFASPDAKLAKAHSTPCTPDRSLAGERSKSITPTPRRSVVMLTRDTRLTPKLQDAERRELRRQLTEEVDDMPSDDDED